MTSSTSKVLSLDEFLAFPETKPVKEGVFINSSLVLLHSQINLSKLKLRYRWK